MTFEAVAFRQGGSNFAIRHRRRGIVGETNDLSVLFVRDRAVVMAVHLVVIVVENLLQSFNLERLEDARGFGEWNEHRGIARYGGADHKNTLSPRCPALAVKVRSP